MTKKDEHDAKLSASWRGDRFGYYMVPFYLTDHMRKWGPWIVRLWLLSMLVCFGAAYYFYDEATASGYFGSFLLTLIGCVCMGLWMFKREKYPAGISYFAIEPEEAVNELKLTRQKDGSWQAAIKRNKQRHIVDIEPFVEIKDKAKRRLNSTS